MKNPRSRRAFLKKSGQIAAASVLGGLIALPSRAAEADKAAQAAAPFPRLMGMNIGAKNYDDPQYQEQLARLNVVILGFYRGWNPRYGVGQVVRNLKKLSHGRILVGQYTILNESYDNPKNPSTLDVRTKINQMDWWARNRAGQKVQWTSRYRTWDINFTAWSKPDANGQRYPEWLAERDNKVLFDDVPFDIWYCVRRLRGTQDVAANNGQGVNVLTLGPKDGIVLQRER